MTGMHSVVWIAVAVPGFGLLPVASNACGSFTAHHNMFYTFNLNKMATILQTPFSIACSWMKSVCLSVLISPKFVSDGSFNKNTIVLCDSLASNRRQTQTQTQTWFIQHKVVQIQNISGHQYIKWTYAKWNGKVVTATALLHLPKTEGQSPPRPATTLQRRPFHFSAHNVALLT